MRLITAVIGTLSLMIQLSAQSDLVQLSLDLQPGTTYQIEVQQQTRFYKSPAQLAEEQRTSRIGASYLQRSQVYQLHILGRTGEAYSVELVRTLSQSYTVLNKFSTNLMDLSPQLKPETQAFFKDTIRFQMDTYGQVLNLEIPDSTATAYAIPDGFRIETQVAVPELVKEFTELFDFLDSEQVSLGYSWLATSGIRFTMIDQQNGLWHIRSSDQRDIYLDPRSKWIRLIEQHRLGLEEKNSLFTIKKDVHQLAKGRIGIGALPVRITGAAPEHKNGFLLLRVTPYAVGADSEHLIEVDANGHFAWQGNFEEPIYFQLTDLYQYDFWGYAKPGGELVLDMQNGNCAVQGTTVQHCWYLNAFFGAFPRYLYLLDLNSERGMNWTYEVDLEQFWQERLKEKEAALRQLTEWSDRLDPEFVALQKRQIEYFRAGLLDLNLRIHHIRQNRAYINPITIPDDYMNYFDNLVLYNNFNHSLPAFRSLLHLDLQRKLFAGVTGDVTNMLYRSYESTYYFAQIQYQNYPLYQTTYDLLQQAIIWTGEPGRIDQLYQHYLSIYSEKIANDDLLEKYRRMGHLTRIGEELPVLTAYNDLGQVLDVKNLKGKPVVFMIVNGNNYWKEIFMVEETSKLFPDIQFVFLHIGWPDKKDDPTPAIENVHHWYARTNSAAAAKAFMQYSTGKHPRAYLVDRRGKIAGTLQSSVRYDDGILPALRDLETGSPLLDKQAQKSILLVAIGLLLGGLLIGLITHQWQRQLHRREYAKRQQVESQLQVIRSQLNPHFMFNSMSSIQHLINSGQPDQAQSYLGKLAHLLRASLRYTRENFISLQEELDMVGQYCELEALRFNFSYDLQIDQQLDTRAISIPPLLLQPYVENAVHHGIAPLRERGKLQVNISEQGQQLWISIRDNGQGLQASRSGPHKGNGIGLQLNAERLRLVYGSAAQVNIYSPSPLHGVDLQAGTEVQIAMPIDV